VCLPAVVYFDFPRQAAGLDLTMIAKTFFSAVFNPTPGLVPYPLLILSSTFLRFQVLSVFCPFLFFLRVQPPFDVRVPPFA